MSTGRGVINWQCQRLVYNNQPGTLEPCFADSGALLLPAYTDIHIFRSTAVHDNTLQKTFIALRYTDDAFVSCIQIFYSGMV